MSLNKPWVPYSEAAARRLSGSLGVYELADTAGQVLYTGYAGGRSRFGLRGAILDHFGPAEPNPVIRERAVSYRVEVNQMYLTRWKELLMRYQAAHGHLPEANTTAGPPPRLGRLSG
jgi:hypothetical protein